MTHQTVCRLVVVSSLYLLGTFSGFTHAADPLVDEEGRPIHLLFVEGTVYAEDSGAPLAGALVWAQRHDPQSNEPSIFGPVQTDADGKYRLEGLPGESLGGWPRTQQLAIMAAQKGYQSGQSILRPEIALTEMDFTLPLAFAFEGRISAPETIEQLQVSVGEMTGMPYSASPNAIFRGETTVNRDGDFRFVVTRSKREPAEADFYPNQTSEQITQWLEEIDQSVEVQLRFSAEGFEAVTVDAVQLVRGETVSGLRPTFEHRASVIAGRAVDEEGNPIPDLSLNLTRVLIEGMGFSSTGPSTPAKTDATGQFRFGSVSSGPHQLNIALEPPFHPAYRIISIGHGSLTLFTSFHGAIIDVPLGANLEDLTLVVERRMRIRGRILLPDGTPLAHATVQLGGQRNNFDGRGSGRSSGTKSTDAEGYYEYYDDHPAYHTLSVEYNGMYASSDAIALTKGLQIDGIDLTLGEEPVDFDLGGRPGFPLPRPPRPPRLRGWVTNPENGHAYKIIACQDWDDAHEKATAEDAHLVTINNAAEQEWLIRTFGGNEFYWIGLTNTEGEWKWVTDEPLTYTNWSKNEPNNMGGENYAVMGWRSVGEWNDLGPASVEWNTVQFAIIEKTQAEDDR